MFSAYPPNRWYGEDPEDTPLPRAGLRDHGKAAWLECWCETITGLPWSTQLSQPDSREHTAVLFPRTMYSGIL